MNSPDALRADMNRKLSEIGTRDAAIAQVLDEVGPPLVKRDPPGFRTLFHTVVAQHVSTASATAVWGRLDAAGAVDPHRLLRLDDETLGTLGLTRAKMRTARAMSEAIVSGSLDLVRLADQPAEQVMEQLTALPGIGRWTAEIYRMFALADADVFPSGDVAIREGVRLLDRLPDRPTPKACDARAETWRPDRTAVTLLLWRLYCVRTGRRVIGVTDDIV
jgi:DNA-3-methyladenine glycosylase II